MDTQETNERWDEIRRIHTQYKFFYLLGGGLLLILFGIWLGWQIFPSEKLIDYNINLWNTLIGAGITVLVIDRLNERRANRAFKADLIYRLGSRVNDEAVRAAEELKRHNNWLEDGSLVGADLWEANLRGAVLYRANLRGATLHRAQLQDANLNEANLEKADLTGANLSGAYLLGANLKGACLALTQFQNAELATANLQDADFGGANFTGLQNWSDRQFVRVNKLGRAIMPDGTYYDGRFNLPNDIRIARDGALAIRENPDDPSLMAHYYGVSIKQYLLGQEWSQNNLSKLLEQD